MKLLIAIVLLIILFILLKSNKYIEDFSNVNDVIFLDKKEVCNLLTKIKINYFDKFNKTDIRARKLKVENIISIYCNNISTFLLDEQNAISWLIHKIRTKINSPILNSKWKFVKFAEIENNYPHTHFDIIFLPQNLTNIILKNYKLLNDFDQMKMITNTLIHEKVHIHQRNNVEEYHKLYTLWNFIKAEKIEGIDKYLNLVRSNPDTDDILWVFAYKNNYYWINSVYKNEYVDNLSYVNYIAIKLEQTGNNIYKVIDNSEINIADIEDFNYFFGNLNINFYHPNEISAEIIAIYYCNMLGILKIENTIAIKRLKYWLSKLKY